MNEKLIICPKCGELDRIDTENFRECYDIGVCGDRFVISYDGRCSVCGFNVVYNIDKPTSGMGRY